MVQSPKGSPCLEKQNARPRRSPGSSKRQRRETTSPHFENLTHGENPAAKLGPKAVPSSPNFMFVPMSTRPGARAKIRPEHRASAKAHVMHDYQRKNAQQRTSIWKMSTPQTYPLAPKMTTTRNTNFDRIAPTQRVTSRHQRRDGRAQNEIVPSSDEVISSDETGPSSQQTPSSGGSRNMSYCHFIHYFVPTVPAQPSGSTLMDVFSALPFKVNAWDETLITRWLNYDRIPWCPVNGQSRWIPFVVRSDMLLHTNLYCWGMHFHGKLTGVESEIFLQENPRILEHKIQAIQLVNEHLASGAWATDEVLAAVSILINTELQFHTRDEAIRHMAGLEAMVNLRGGLDTLTTMGEVGILLQRMISWNDLFFVELFGGTLRFAHLPRWEAAWQSVFAPIMDDPVTHLEPLQARFAGNAARELTTMLREIQLVCDDVRARPLETLSTPERTLRHDTLLRFERRLCLATRITTVGDEHAVVEPVLSGGADALASHSNTGTGDDAMWRAVATAALMYVHHHIRAHALHWAQFPALVVQLRNELALVRDRRVWDTIPSLYTWVLAVGGWVSQREEWIVRLLAEECRERGCVEWDDFLETMKLGPILGRLDEEKLTLVWDGVVQYL